MRFKSCLLVAAMAACGVAQAFTPAAGTWVVTAEVNGKPGRGFAIDVQNGTLVMQMYAYEKSSAATFYMGSASYAGNMAMLPLKQYKGGRYLGSGDLYGVESASPGTAVLQFSSATQGTMTLPGEKAVAISRFEFGYPAGKPEGLQGTWVLTGIGNASTDDRVEWAPLTQAVGATDNGSGLMASADGTIGCEQQIKGAAAGSTICVVRNSAGMVRTYDMEWSVNEGEGNMYDPSGKYLGAMVAKRMRDAKGNTVGFLRAAPVADTVPASLTSGDEAALLQAIRTAVATQERP